MAKPKRVFLTSMLVVLVAGICGITFSASAEPNEGSDDFIGEVQDAESNAFDLSEMDTPEAVPTEDDLFDAGIMDDSSSEDVDPSGSVEGIVDEVCAGDDGEEAIEDTGADEAPEEVVVLPKESLGFVYVDQPRLTVGDSQSIAVGLSADNVAMDEAMLHVAKEGSSEPIDVTAEVIEGPAALFILDFGSESDAGSYYLSAVEYREGDTRYYLDLGHSSLESLEVIDGEGITEFDNEIEVAEINIEENQPASDSGLAVYGFEVVSQEVINIVGETMDSIDGDTVLAFDGSDTVTVTESVDEALDVIDDAVDFESVDSASEMQDASSFDIADLMGVEKAYASSNGNLVVAIDPGHGGSDNGASGNGLHEKDCTLTIAQHMYNELRTYSKVAPYMTRTSDVYVGLSERVNRAVKAGADVFVSLHLNAANITAHGAEVWVPNNSSYRKATTSDVGRALGNKILSQLTSLGLTNRGVKTRDATNGEKYPDGQISDYYTVINECRRNNIPAIIVEHAFIDNAGDAIKYLKSDTALNKLGVADAKGVAQQYGLKKGALGKNSVSYQAHVQNVGWQPYCYNGSTAGTTGRSLRVEAMRVSLDNPECSGGVQIRSHVQNIGWQNWVSNGALSGTTDRSLRVEAVQVKLTGEMANRYDVLYRAHVQNVGWQGWVKNGATAGTTGQSLRVEAIEIKLQKKASSITGSPSISSGSLSGKYVAYQTHVQNVGWQSLVADGRTAGTSGQSLRLEAIQLHLGNASGGTGSIQYRTHVQNIGWEGSWRKDGAVSGTTGQSLRLEAIQINLTGDVAKRYDVYYRAHVQNIGWQSWVKNGATAGTTGRYLRLEALEVKLVEKVRVPIMGGPATSASATQMVKYFNANKKTYPSIYASKGAATIDAFAKIVVEEATAEGVRPDVVFCQAMKETGWLQFGGDVKADQCNFAGIGAVGGGAKGQSFKDVRTGIRAQVQHLKAYASTAPLKNACVDPRFALVSRGCAPYLSDLNGRWAVPGDGYGQGIATMIDKCKSY